jgi:RNA polymerase sigma-70 factor (ECF subfamily)
MTRTCQRARITSMTSRAAEDIELLNRYLGGDVDAFDELVRAHEDRVLGICLRMMRDREAALDAVQETFITVFRKADRYEARAAFSTWLYRVAVNTCYDQLRKQKRRRTEPLPEVTDPVDPRGGDEFEAIELRPEIEKALQRVPVDFRSAVVLVDLQGLALEQAAQILDVPIGTVKSRVFRGRKVLAESLGNLRAGSRHPRDE